MITKIWRVAALAAVLAFTASAADLPRLRIDHKTRQVDGVKIFYREAGSPSRPTIVLLHGYPSSSHMFRELIPKLAGNYHVIAPDLPGFGYSDQPTVDKFEYTFAHLTDLMDEFLTGIGVEK